MTPLMTEKAPLLVCAATRWEHAPLTLALAGARAAVLKTGVGPRNAAAALSLVREKPRLVVSAGFCGALQPKMFSGDVVLEVAGLELEIPQAARRLAAEKGYPLHFGRIFHSDTVLSTPAQKTATAREHRAVAVDMESSAIRDWAARNGVPFLAARVVLDAVDESLPADIPESEDIFTLAKYAVTRPSQIPLMVRTGLRQGPAMSRLANFLRDLLPSL